MADDPKGRIFFMLDYLTKNTDEDHTLTTNQLLQILKENGHPVERKTLRADMDALADAGYDIVRSKGIGNSYFLGSRAFDEPEIRLLIDAVTASKVISRNRTQKINAKLLHFLSRYQARTIRRSIREQDARVKTENEQLLYISDRIHEAIDDERKISFQYWEETPENGRQLKNNGEVYVVSPFATVWNNDRYYMVGWSDKRDKIVSFRIDRMALPNEMDEAAHAVPEDFDPERYMSQVFGMMDGPVEKVTIRFRPNLMDAVTDRFGSGLTVREENGCCVTDVDVAVSTTFFAWVFTFDGGITVQGPEKVVRGYRDMLNRALGKPDENEE